MSPDISLLYERDSLVLEYRPHDSNAWLVEKVAASQPVRVVRVFSFLPDDLISPTLAEIQSDDVDEYSSFSFRLGTRSGPYYRVEGRKLSISQDVFVGDSFLPSQRHFVAPRKVSVFRQIARLSREDVYVGGPEPTAIPVEDFERLVGQMPTELELQKYVSARCSSILRSYMGDVRDAEADYEQYRNRRESVAPDLLSPSFREYEFDKYRRIAAKLGQMLDSEGEYSERRWQEEIADILLLLYPQYVRAFREAPIIDTNTGKKRSVDFLLMDYNGNVDALEIKKPFDKAVVTSGVYRDNHVPMRTLSGTVIQVEKYLYHLVRSGNKGVAKLHQRFKDQLPEGVEINVINPQGLVLLGRDSTLSSAQRLDFEVIRRHYKNVVDVITYDDLLRRLGSLLRLLEAGEGNPDP